MTLAAKRVLITRPREKAGSFADELRRRGALPVFFPTIKISPARDSGPLDRALEDLESYDWLVLTSANAVDAVWARLRELGSLQLPHALKVAAVGPKTAASLQERGVDPLFVPEEYVAEAIVPGLGDLRGRRVLLPQADIAHQALPDAIRAASGSADVVTAYHTGPARPDDEGWRALREGVDVVTFTSGSTVFNFVAIVREAGLDPGHLPGAPRTACIGPKTARAAVKAGLAVDIIPDDYTVAGLIGAIERYFVTPSHQGV